MTNITCDLPETLGDIGSMMSSIKMLNLNESSANLQDIIPSGLGCVLDGEGVIRRLNFDENNVVRNFIALCGLLFAFRLLAFICLNIRARILR